MSSPKNRRKNATLLPCSPSSMNPLMTFMNTNKLSTIQRTLQSRKLFNKINKVNAIISDEKIKWNSSPNSSDLNGNQNKFLMLINKNQAPLQINPRIRMRKSIENMMKMNKIESPLDQQKSQNLLTSPRESDAKASLSKDADEVDFKSIKKSIKQISQISRYFDRVYKIDKKQKYLKIDTIDYWKRIDTTPSKKKELIEIYSRVHKDEKFTFSDYQKEYEAKWLEILKNLQEKDKASILFLINGGHHEDDIEEQVRMFDPNKIIQRLEYKKLLEEKKTQKQAELDSKSPSRPLFFTNSPKPNQKTPSEAMFSTQRQSSLSNKITQNESKSNGFHSELPLERNKGKSAFAEKTLNKKKTQTYTSFENIPEVNSPSKSIRSQIVLKNFLHENMPPPQSTKSIVQPQKTKILLDPEKMKQFQAKDIIAQTTTMIKRSRKSKIKDHSNEIQECNCKHAHNIQCYQLKKDHKSIFKIPSVLPPTRKTFMEIRRASNMPYTNNQKPKIDFDMLKQFSQEKDREMVFLEKLKNNINDSYDNRDSSPQKNNFILEK